MPDYTGDVRPGGPADVRELDALTIRKVSVGDMDNDAYLLTCRATGEQPARRRRGRRAPAAAAGRGGWRRPRPRRHHPPAPRPPPRAAGRGRGHRCPHGRGCGGRRRPAGARRRPARGRRRGAVRRGRAAGDAPARPHPGSVALRYDDPAGRPHLFTGDSLFPGGVGNTRGDAAAFTSLLRDVEERLFDVLPDDTWVYPGHGADTTLGAERPHLTEWRERGW
nr:MBL fold metallo-hydrolase [Angustibacter aerolatus]